MCSWPRPCVAWAGFGDETAELRWVAAGDLPDRLFAPDRPVLRDAFEPPRHRPVIG
ncbi:MAG: hypothetical protein H0U28_01560 [Nocardioidaceae bacterium]|nr:hypothetical protein [Nocardioidaceae bacterium]